MLNITDKTAGKIVLKNVKNARKVKELISDNIEIQRDKKRVTGREFMVADIEEDENKEN